MLKILSTLFSIAAILTLSSNAHAQVPVTFNVNMGIIGPSDSLHVVGNFQDPNYDNVADNPDYVNWTPNASSGLMTDDDMDFIYSTTLFLEPGRYEFRFVNGNDWQFSENVPEACTVEVNGNSNRQIMVGTAPISYSVCYGECADCGQYSARVRVDMSSYDDDGNGIGGEPGIDIHPEGIFMNGSFVSWSTFVPLQDWDGDKIWEGLISTYEAAPIEFKFINGPDWIFPNESISGSCGAGNGNRLIPGLSDVNTVLPVYCWNSCDPCSQPVPITFNVNLNSSCLDTSSGVSLMGTATDWANGALMNDDDGDGIWTITLNLEVGTYEYKFRVGSGGWEGISNRQLTVIADNPEVLPIVCFNATAPCTATVPIGAVTFQVNLGNYSISPGQVLWVMGDFTSPAWQDGALQMNDNDGDGTWSVTASQVCPSTLLYKFRIGTPGSNNFIEENADFSSIGGCGIDNGIFSDNRLLVRTDSSPIEICSFFNSCQTCLIQSIPGCTDINACNYNPIATSDDGSCNYDCPPCPTNDGIDVIWTDDFSNPSSWTIAHDGTFNSNFQIGPGLESTGSYGTPAILSTTAANGYAMYNSDGYNNSAGIAYEQPHITTSNPINLSGYPNVILEFQTQYRRFTDEQAWLIVSNDGTFPVLDDPNMDISSLPGVFRVWENGELTQSVSPGNPTIRSFNISEIAGNSPQVWIRFHFTGIWGYAWYIDDVRIIEQSEYDANLSEARLNFSSTSIEYGRIPVELIANSFNASCILSNSGANPLNNVSLELSIIETNLNTSVYNDILFTTSTLSPGDEISFNEDVFLSSLPEGSYDALFFLQSTEQSCDGNTANNVQRKKFQVTSSEFGIDSYELYPQENEILGSLGTNSFIDNSDGFMTMSYYELESQATIYGIDVYFASGTVAGGQIIAEIHDTLEIYNNNIFSPIISSNPYTITEADIVNGKAFIPFDILNSLPPNGYYASATLYSDGNLFPIRILDALTITQPDYASLIYLPTDQITYNNGNAFCIRMILDPAEQLDGCTNSQACNYDPNANTENGNCIFPGAACNDNNPNTIYDLINDNCECIGYYIPENCANEIFISEYVEGTSNNKAIELYNPSSAPILLTGSYSMGRFRDGVTTPMLVDITGIIPAHDVRVFALDKRDPNGTGTEIPISPLLEAVADTFLNPVYIQNNSPMYYNGDDAFVLIKNGNEIIDLIGEIGYDPGGGWSQPGDPIGAWWTTDNTMVRKPDILEGVTINPTDFDPSLEWDTLATDDFSHLGWHSTNCIGEISGCMNIAACNYNPTATINDGSCIVIGNSCNDNNASTINDVIQSNCQCAGTLIDPGCTGFSVSNTANNPTCAGFANGSISVNISGNSGPYTYSWSNGSTSSAINSVLAGAYSVTITDATGCAESLSFNLTAPAAISAVTSVSPAACFGDNTGSASVAVSGGTGPYAYAWNTSPIQNTAQINNVSAGNYTVNITDAAGCQFSSNAIITQPTQQLLVNAATTSATCSQSDGTATAVVTGNTGTIQYLWSNGQIGATASNLAAGSYSVIVTSGGCSAQTFVNVNNTNAPVINQVHNSPTCFGANNGSINTLVTGGTQPYQYLWSNGGSGTSQSGLTAGDYTFIVIDNAGCQSSIFVSLIQPDPISIVLSTTPTACTGAPQGAIVSTVSGGVEPYQFSWSNGTSGTSITNLPAGDYSLNITDANGCSAQASANVISPNGVTAFVNSTNVNCPGGSDGVIEIIITNGEAPFEYSWSNGASGTNLLTNLISGSYSCTITDSNGCTFNASAILEEPQGNIPEILGLSTVDPFSLETYSVSQLTDVTYTWVVIGGNILSGQGGNFIQVQWSDQPTAVVSLILSYANGCESIIELPIQIGVSVNETGSYPLWSVYPNPAAEELIIELSGAHKMLPYIIYDVNGRVVLHGQISAGKNNVVLGELAAGIYCVEVQSSSTEIQRQRILKK